MCSFILGRSFLYPFQISLRLTLVAFPRPVSLPAHAACQLLSDRVSSLTLCCQTASFITLSPSLGHASYRRWMSFFQGYLGNGPHPDFETGLEIPVTPYLFFIEQSERERRCNKQFEAEELHERNVVFFTLWFRLELHLLLIFQSWLKSKVFFCKSALISFVA